MVSVYVYSPSCVNPNITKINNVKDQDAKYFNDNEINISMEYLGGDYIVYGCKNDDDEEIIVLSKGRSCEDTLSELAKKLFEKYENPELLNA